MAFRSRQSAQGGSKAAAQAANTSNTGATAAGVMPLPPGLQLHRLTPLARAALAAEEGIYGGCETPSPATSASTSAAGGGGGGSSGEGGKLAKGERGGCRPVRTKVTAKDFSKFDIDPTKIHCCQDPRTTVMVRGLCGPTARKDFLRFLERCGLQERYTFFYMPCKEHRNIPAGFAFVNFAAPTDVHKLYVMVRSGFWREFMTDPMAKVPAVSYARFQGHEELAKHFSSSAVLHELDPDKRPIFRLEVLKAMKEETSPQGEDVTEAPRRLRKAAAAAAPEPLPQPAMEPASVVLGEEQVYTAKVQGKEPTYGMKVVSGLNEDWHVAVSNGAKEITAILMRGLGEAVAPAEMQHQAILRADLPVKVLTSGSKLSCGESWDSYSSLSAAGIGA